MGVSFLAGVLFTVALNDYILISVHSFVYAKLYVTLESRMGLPKKVPEDIWRPTTRSFQGPEARRTLIRNLELH
jgi:hypothetical protein